MKGRLGTLTALYVTQYLGVGFITVGLTAILRDGGTSLDTLALLQIVGLIWPIKFLWAPILDRYGSRHRGHYRSWLLVLQTALVLALLALLPFTDPADALGPIVAICAAYVFFSATQDIAVDAVAVRMLAESSRGTGNGIQVAASYLGNLLGGGACVLVYDQFGWAAAIGLLAAMTAVGLLVVWRFREPPRTDRVDRVGTAYRALLSVFGQPGCRWWTFGVVPLVYVGAGMAYALVTPALVDAGWSLGRIGVVTGVVTSVPAIVAGLVAGLGIGRFGRGGVLVVGGVALTVSTLLLLPLMNGRAPLGGTVAALCCFMVAYTIANVVLYTVNMDYSRPDTGGTDFTVLSSFGLVCSFVAASIGLAAADGVGYPPVAIAAIVLVAAGVVLGLAHQRRFPRRPGPVGSTAAHPTVDGVKAVA
ncbi:putative MFS family arabinose efflux permease [Micromonospora jinlongensis]|uniref:Putative MFS family arabinose efflux permease n=1 Tax=Micromonospora jinlongensis TaxID=1287877 RepID=A0A7Z0BH04_9ACTN|nr:MFS transporter [Micromonospora jinlongensis]NYH44729.1 putative MFS family arabinose efflux permease [Micromonospora jinlongensis]